VYCPHCRAEYRPGFTECADCGIPLVYERPPGPEHPPGDEPLDLVTVLRTSEPIHLAVAKSILAAAGVPFVVKNEETTTLRPLPMAFPAEVQVRREDAERAGELLRRSLEDPLEGPCEDPQDPPP
jgi:hypothetical protein